MKFLVVGLGSMGKRRIRNLKHLKEEDIIGFDISAERRKEAEEKHGIKTFESMELALKQNPDAFIISTPPNHHMEVCLIAARNKKHFFVEASVLIEKDFKKVIILSKQNKIVAAPSCTMRYHPLVKKIKEIVDSKKYGRPVGIVYHMGQYLPDWHPWEEISNFYVGRRETSAAREMVCFELEWINWIFGDINKLSCFKGNYSSIKADIDDAYALNIEYKNKIIANIMIEVFARHAYRQFKVMFEEGVLEWDWIKETLRIYDANTKKWSEIKEDEGIRKEGYLAKENMYIDEVRNFVNAIKGKEKWEYTLDDDLKTLKLLLDAEKSSDEKKHVFLK